MVVIDKMKEDVTNNEDTEPFILFVYIILNCISLT